MYNKKAHLPTFGIIAVFALALAVIANNVDDASYFMAQTRNAVTDRGMQQDTNTPQGNVARGVQIDEIPSVIINRYGYDTDAQDVNFSEAKEVIAADDTSVSNLEFLGVDVGTIEAQVTDASFVHVQDKDSNAYLLEKEEGEVRVVANNDNQNEATKESGRVLGAEDTQQEIEVIYVDDVRDTSADGGKYRPYDAEDEVYEDCESVECEF